MDLCAHAPMTRLLIWVLGSTWPLQRITCSAALSNCFPIVMQYGKVGNTHTATWGPELCCPHGGWPLCQLGILHRRSLKSCCGADAHWEQMGMPLELMQAWRAFALAEMEEKLMQPPQLIRSPAGFYERSRMLPARIFARLLESRTNSSRDVTCVEVGVQRGRFAHSFLTALWAGSLRPADEVHARKARRRHGLPMDLSVRLTGPEWTGGPGSLRGHVEYVLVDLWQQRPLANDSDNMGPHVQLTNLQATISLLEPFWPHVRVVQQSSKLASRLHDLDSIDFVYVDAAHDYASVLADLEAWWPRVRPGGMLGGDDFDTKGVADAVSDFFGALGIQQHALGSGNNFFAVKP